MHHLLPLRPQHPGRDFCQKITSERNHERIPTSRLRRGPGLPFGRQRRGDLPGGGHGPADPGGLWIAAGGGGGAGVPDRQHSHPEAGAHHADAADRLSRQRPGRRGAAQRPVPEALRPTAGAGRGPANAPGGAGLRPPLFPRSAASGPLSGGGRLRGPFRLLPDGCSLGRALRNGGLLCQRHSGPAGGQAHVQHSGLRLFYVLAGLWAERGWDRPEQRHHHHWRYDASGAGPGIHQRPAGHDLRGHQLRH